jgi:DNA-binding SARP family transcriptional activator
MEDISRHPRVSVLGNAAIDGVELTRRQRPLVAALAFHMPGSVSIECLIDCVWPMGPPATARQSIHNQVARVRDRFGQDLIETIGAGYRLAARTDVAEVERLAAYWLVQPPSPASVVPLSSALSLWRGTPYLDLCDRYEVLAEQSRLAQVRTQIAELLSIGRMLAGDHANAIDELFALTAQDPYGERAWGLLMIALYLADRRNDALAVFDRASLEFATGLGSSPSAALSDLRTSIAESRTVPIDRWTGPLHPSQSPGTGAREAHGRYCVSCLTELASEIPHDRRLRVVATSEAGFERTEQMLAEQHMLFGDPLHRSAQ